MTAVGHRASSIVSASVTFGAGKLLAIVVVFAGASERRGRRLFGSRRHSIGIVLFELLHGLKMGRMERGVSEQL